MDIDVIIPVRVTTLFSCDCVDLEVIMILTSNSVYFWDTISGSRYESRGRSADSVQTGQHLPRGVHQKSVYWTHLHHACQAMRKKTVRRKFNAMSLEFAGKNVLIVDGKHYEL